MSTLKADTIVASDGTSPVTLTKQTAAKHLCVFDGTGTAAVDESFNNSSLTDNGTGRYAIAVTNAFTNLHFVFTGATVGNDEAFTYINTHSAKKTASTAAFRCVQYDGNFFDMDTVDVVSHGDLA
ncbi:MAG: hypothetical protein CMG96_03105 [Marinovum sp.]|nr:hypothetical protein [Marinovum sp.]|tara:strand:- start:1120 stop:1494 length:375 start_codon:yes stop_codon:yes gene_type:complete